MTKERPSLTVEATAYDVIEAIGVQRAAHETRRAPGYLVSLTDADTRFQLTVRDMLTLDRTYDQVTGKGFPIYETCGLLLGIDRPAQAAPDALGRQFAALLRECGEAHEAVVALITGSDDPHACEHAKRQLHEAISAFTQTVRLVVHRATARAPP